MLILTLVSSADEEEPAPLPNPTPYVLISGGLLLGLLALALASGWWAVVRSDRLLSRPENPRRAINDRYVPRGALLDRNNQRIAYTTGSPGEFRREYAYPPLSSTTGYNSPLYGQGGLEAGLDETLRGIDGNPTTLIMLNNLLFGQTPPGLDVRLTIDLEIQNQADQLLADHRGALVLMNARSGEILAIASHPSFDANQLDENWIDLLQDPNAPLLNRATQGQYPPGPALGPFLYAYAIAQGAMPTLPNTWDYTSPEGEWACAVQPSPPYSMSDRLSSGCPALPVALGERLGAEKLEDLFASLGFYEQPDLPLLTAIPSARGISRTDLAAIGQENLLVTPLQMALAAAALSNNGILPVPQITAAVLPPQQDWIPFPVNAGKETLLEKGVQKALITLVGSDASYWQSVALARANEETITWYLAGTLSEQQEQGTPLALAVVLEERNPELAMKIGQALISQ